MARKEYAAGTVAVSYDPALCIHAAECVAGLPKVFDPQARPWIRPQHASPEEIERVVAKCPTGALAFRRVGAPAAPAHAPAPAPGAPTIVTVKPDGPLIVEGGVVVKDATGGVLLAAERVALCRCSHSAKKPFCDGAHGRVGWKAV